MIAILGAGKMGEALISGLLRAGRNPVEVLAAFGSKDFDGPEQSAMAPSQELPWRPDMTNGMSCGISSNGS